MPPTTQSVRARREAEVWRAGGESRGTVALASGLDPGQTKAGSNAGGRRWAEGGEGRRRRRTRCGEGEERLRRRAAIFGGRALKGIFAVASRLLLLARLLEGGRVQRARAWARAWAVGKRAVARQGLGAGRWWAVPGGPGAVSRLPLCWWRGGFVGRGVSRPRALSLFVYATDRGPLGGWARDLETENPARNNMREAKGGAPLTGRASLQEIGQGR